MMKKEEKAKKKKADAERKHQKRSKDIKQRGDDGDLPSTSPALNATAGPDSYSNNSWVFRRAERRNDARKEAAKSDWLFKRARDRKRFHRLAAAEWHNRRLLARLDCEDEGDEGCEDVGKVNTAYVVKSTEAFRQWEYRSEKGKKRRGDESRIIDVDDDDEDED